MIMCFFWAAKLLNGRCVSALHTTRVINNFLEVSNSNGSTICSLLLLLLVLMLFRRYVPFHWESHFLYIKLSGALSSLRELPHNGHSLLELGATFKHRVFSTSWNICNLISLRISLKFGDNLSVESQELPLYLPFSRRTSSPGFRHSNLATESGNAMDSPNLASRQHGNPCC